MNPKFLLIARYAVAALCLGVGAYPLGLILWSIATHFQGRQSDWLVLLTLPFVLVPFGVLIVSGYYLLRERYRSLAFIWINVATLVIWFIIIDAPRILGFDHRDRHTHDMRLGWIYLLCLLGAFYVAKRFYSLALRLLDRHLPRPAFQFPESIAGTEGKG